ncbi:MAG: tetratricopeptide repeat protein [Halobacteriovoraceae bacterium]|nr:tetratricopeptide repeat protein [Halobacteriovoraceae bacterium]
MKNNFLFLILIFLCGCDFTTSIHREVLQAQEDLQSQNYNEALKHYERIVQRRINKELKLKILFIIGEIYSNYLSDYEKAKNSYFKILEQEPDLVWQVKVTEKLADVEFDYLKDYKKSFEYYQKLHKFTPPLAKNDYYQYKMARSLFEMGSYFKSYDVFEKIIQKTTSQFFLKAFYYQGLIHFYKQEWEAAVKKWKIYLRYEKNKKDIVNVKFFIANAYEMQEKLRTAYNVYYSIIAEYPNPEVIEKRLKALYERRVARKR